MLGRIGRKQIEMMTAFTTTAMGFGGAAFVTLLYFTDWKVFVRKIPYYNGKFEGLEEEEKSS